MKPLLGDDISVESSFCLNCGEELNRCTPIGDNRRPQDGDITICLCGHIMAFDANEKIRALTDDEMIKIAGNKQIVLVLNALEQVRKEQKKVKKPDPQ